MFVYKLTDTVPIRMLENPVEITENPWSDKSIKIQRFTGTMHK